jgi:hypothetical protein
MKDEGGRMKEEQGVRSQNSGVGRKAAARFLHSDFCLLTPDFCYFRLLLSAFIL